MTITEAAQNVNRSRQTIYNYVKSGKLKAKRNGKGYEIDLEDLQEAFDMSNEASKSVNEVSSDPSKVDTSNSASNEVSNFDKYIDTLLRQLEEKDKQIQELHQIVAMQQKSIQQLTEQNQLLLEDRRKKPPFWKRLFSKS